VLSDPNDFRASEYLARPTCRARLTTPFELTTGVSAAIPLDDTDLFDAFSLHVTGANTRITISVPGIYAVGGNATFAANATGIRFLGTQINGTAAVVGSVRVDAAAAGTTILNVHGILNFVANDYVELVAQQTSGGPLNVTGAAMWAALVTKA